MALHYKLSEKFASNRSDKIFLNKLNSLNNELRGSDTAMRIMCNNSPPTMLLLADYLSGISKNIFYNKNDFLIAYCINN